MLRYLLGGFAAICLFMIAKSVIEHAPQPAAAGFADGQQNIVTAPMPTGSTTPDLNATAAASGKSTMDAANTATGNERATQAEGTRMASTQTPMAWTAQAADAQRQQAEAEREKVLAEVQILAGTITAAPTSQWKTEVAYWPTMQAQQTQAVYDQQLADRQRWWGRVMNDLTGALIPVLLASVMLAALVSAVVMPAALSWRLQGVNGGQAQATVEAARSVTVNENKQSRQMVTDGERAQLIAFVDECIKTSGPDARQITPQSEFESAETWSQMVRRLRAMSLVTPQRGNGNGTDINGGLTLSGLALALRKGTTA